MRHISMNCWWRGIFSSRFKRRAQHLGEARRLKLSRAELHPFCATHRRPIQRGAKGHSEACLSLLRLTEPGRVRRRQNDRSSDRLPQMLARIPVTSWKELGFEVMVRTGQNP